MQGTIDHDSAEVAQRALLGWLEGFRLGEARQSGGLAVVPVYMPSGSEEGRYLTLADALGRGDAVVAEQPQASVPTLQVHNHGALPILILDGEEVVGGKQNRVVNVTILVPANSVFDLPVSCVEHGRWHEAAPTFSSGEAAYPTLRRQKMEQVSASLDRNGGSQPDQGAIWNEIAARQVRDGVASSTGAMRDGYLHRAEELASAERELEVPEDGPLGVVALLGGRAHCADLFDSAATLRTYWPRLVRSYALEAADARPADPSKGSADRLLLRPSKARLTIHKSAGLGVEVRVAGNGVVGAALVVDSTPVHVALFRRRAAATHTTIRQPSERARWYQSR